jgi:hypothetical protein
MAKPGGKILPFKTSTDIDALLFDFDIDSFQLKAEHEKFLDEVIAFVEAPGHGPVTVSIDGFASRTGTAKHNLILSENREEAVEDYLRTHTRAFDSASPHKINRKFHGFSDSPPGEKATFRSVRIVVHRPGLIPPPVPVPPVTPPVSPPSAKLRSVKIWLNSFIPKTVPGVTHPVTAGPFLGSTFVFGPPVPTLTIPPTLKRGEFLTSNRAFDSSDTRIPSHFKMHSDITISFPSVGNPIVGTPVHVGGESIEIDPVTGAILRRAVGSTARMVIVQLPNLLAPKAAIKLVVKMSCAIPLIFGASLVADMDIIGTLTVFPSTRSVTFNGKVDEFPAYEAYASGDGGPPVRLFNVGVLPGKTPSDLIGLPTIPVSSTVTV